ncbi:kinesin motor domain protein [Pelomyxa schiedti]|nr:kinesin motor domain protein [Pelomyxa schiedti]
MDNDRLTRLKAINENVQSTQQKATETEYTEYTIHTCGGEVFAVGCGSISSPLALILPGYPGGWDDWEYMFAPLASYGWHPVGVDMPGFGRSTGTRQNSRTEYHAQPNGANQTVHDILDFFKVSPTRKCLLLGFDWGGGIALSTALSPSEAKRICAIVSIHPSWTENLALLNRLTVSTQLLWVPVEQFHSYTLGKKLARAIPKCTLVTLDIGHYTDDKPSGIYYCISPQIIEKVTNWIPAPSAPKLQGIMSNPLCYSKLAPVFILNLQLKSSKEKSNLREQGGNNRQQSPLYNHNCFS